MSRPRLPSSLMVDKTKKTLRFFTKDKLHKLIIVGAAIISIATIVTLAILSRLQPTTQHNPSYHYRIGQSAYCWDYNHGGGWVTCMIIGHNQDFSEYFVHITGTNNETGQDNNTKTNVDYLVHLAPQDIAHNGTYTGNYN